MRIYDPRTVQERKPVGSIVFRCDTRHPAKNSEIWAESKLFGFIWVYYTCVSGVVYDITPWATCKVRRKKGRKGEREKEKESKDMFVDLRFETI